MQKEGYTSAGTAIGVRSGAHPALSWWRSIPTPSTRQFPHLLASGGSRYRGKSTLAFHETGLSSRRVGLVGVGVLVALGLGITACAASSQPARTTIEAPHLKSVMCVPPMWLKTQSGRTQWLGDCLGQLYAPPSRMTLLVGSVFAVGCVPGSCHGLPPLAISSPHVVAFRGRLRGVAYFEVVAGGSATLWATAKSENRLLCTTEGTPPVQPTRCPVITIEGTRSS